MKMFPEAPRADVRKFLNSFPGRGTGGEKGKEVNPGTSRGPSRRRWGGQAGSEQVTAGRHHCGGCQSSPLGCPTKQ